MRSRLTVNGKLIGAVTFMWKKGAKTAIIKKLKKNHRRHAV